MLNFNGDIDLNFDITDGDATLQATADLTVNPVNDLPTVGEPQFVTQEDTSFTFTEEQLLQNAGDIDGDNLSVENVASDSGSLVDNGDGTYTFAPNENFDGNVNVTFDVNDGTAIRYQQKRRLMFNLWLICQSCRLRLTW